MRLRRDPRRLPGTLCDETPATEAGKWQPREPEVPVIQTTPQDVDHAALAREAIHALADDLMDLRRQLGMATHDLAEMTADRDRLSVACGIKDQRIRGLELTVQALGGHAPTRSGDTAEMPRQRSLQPRQRDAGGDLVVPWPAN